MAYIETWVKQEMTKPVKVQYLGGNLFSQDSQGNLLGVELFKDGVAYSGGGTVSGTVIRADGETVAIDTGSITENKAQIILPASAYAVIGAVTIIIKLTHDGQTATIGAFVSMVYATSTDTVVDPGTIIPSISDLIAEINEAVASIPPDYSALTSQVNGLKSATNVWDSLTNDGIHTISAGELEQGQWSYSAKAANSARIRFNTLIPVKAGMSIVYSSQTQDIYFGVLATPTSGSYLPGLSGWKSAPITNGIFNITQDGWMTFIVRDHADNTKSITPEDYDCSVTIYTAESDLRQYVEIAGTKYPLIQGGFSSDYNTFYNTPKRIHTAFASIPQGNYEITIDADYTFFVVIHNSDSYALLEGIGNRLVIPCMSDCTYAIVIKQNNDNDISILENTCLLVTAFEPKTLSLGEKIDIATHGAVLIYSFPFVEYSGISTEIIKMPKGGICIGTDRTTQVVPMYRARFFRIENNVFVPAEDYEFAGVDWESQTTFSQTSAALYFPYDEDLYFQVSCDSSSSAPYINIGYESELHGYGRLLTLGMISIYYPGGVATPNFRNYSGSYKTSQYLYGSVVRAQDVKRIVSSPKYSLSAWVYRENENPDTEHLEPNEYDTLIYSVYGGALFAGATGGIQEIDLSEYNDPDEYAVIVVMATQTRNGSAAECDTMGCLAQHDDVLNNIYVEYENKTVIWHKPGMDPIISRNIDTLKHLRFPTVFAHNYRGNWTSKNMPLNEMHDATLGFYNGNSVADVPLSNVSMKSYATAVKNLNSRVYVGNWIAPNPGATTLGFGMICSNLPQILCGMEEQTDSYGFWLLANYMGHTTEVFTMADVAEKIKPGDWMHGRTMDIGKVDYHVGLVTDVVYVNGAPFCIEYIESYPPMLRYRYMYLQEPFKRRFNWEYSADESADDFYSLLSRPPHSALSLMRDKWNLDIDYSVGTLMCDRGTDSVYCAGNGFCYITLADNAITSIDVYVNGSKKKTITIANRQKITLSANAPQAIDIISDIRECGAGYYTLIPNNKQTAQESFYVPPTPETASIELTNNGQTYTITPDDSQEIVQIWARYFARSGGEEEEDTDYYYNPDTGEWEEIDVPHGDEPPVAGKKSINMCWRASAMVDGSFVIPATLPYLGYTFYFDYCHIVYKTNYGTFTYGRDIGYDEPYPYEWCNSDRVALLNKQPIT